MAVRSSPLALAVVILTGSTAALAQVAPTGSIAPTTIKLPDGPGSVAGLAKPAEMDAFSAQVEYSIPVRTPSVGGMSPTVSLAYSGALGNGPLGIGWTLSTAAIRRSLRDGVPHYDDRDELTIEGVGSGRLVLVRPDEYVVEDAGCTLRVRRLDQRYFEVTDADGTRYYLGHTAAARQGSGGKVAAWFVEEVINLAGERMRFEYATDRGQVYLHKVLWGPGERYRLEVIHETRTDEVTSYATGLEVTTARRVRELRTAVALPGQRSQELARYTLGYRGGALIDPSLSRLISVTMSGRRDADGRLLDDATLPPVRLDYAEPDPARRWQLDAGGWVVDQRGVAMVDVDGDGADDLLRLEPGYAAWRRNVEGRFESAASFGNASALELDEVRFLDVDGDARPEVVRIVDDTWRAYRIEAAASLSTGRVLDGSRGVSLGGDGTVLADVDGDGRTDVIEAVTGGLRMRRGVPTGFAPPAYLPPISADRSIEPGAAGVRFLDANGDGLADVVRLTDTWMKVYLGRGDGTFAAYSKVFYPWGTAAIPIDHVHLVDLDRDGLLDLVRVDAGKVRWFSGLAGVRFTRFPRQLDRPPGADVDVRVSFADVDGNGSEEVVWASSSAMWALDLAGGTTRAMLASIDDGMGEVTRIGYGASTQLAWQAERDGQPWTRTLPRSIAVPVRQETVYGDGTPTRLVNLGIRDGFWDGEERRFGGFLGGRTVAAGDSAADQRVERVLFHEGAGSERVLRGQVLEKRIEDGLGALYRVETTGWEALLPRCLDAAVDPSNPLLRRAVQRRHEVAHHEGVARPIRTLIELSYDAEARVFQEHHHGRVDLPGDEAIARKDYASDETTGVRDRVITESLHRGDGALVSQLRHRFGNHIGDPLPHGQIGFGWPRLTEANLWQGGSRPTAPRWVVQSSKTYDAHGNVVSATDGPTAGDNGVGVTRSFTYDADGLFALTETVRPRADAELVWSATWDEYLGVVSTVTEPAGNTTHLEYDGLGRVTALRQNALPAHQRYVYDWTAPRPRTFSYAFDGAPTALAGAAGDWHRVDRYRGWRHTVTVADSAGDALYTAGRLDASRWLVTGWKRKDGRGRITEVLEGFTHAAAELPAEPPTGRPLRRQVLRYDALDRVYEHRLPSGAGTRTTYKAFEESVHAEGLAPVTSRFDGQGRIVHTDRTIVGADGSPTIESVDATYDAAGRILALELQRPGGSSSAACAPGSAVPWVSHCFVYDSAGRLVEADDPDIGLRQMTYDDANRMVRHVNGAGQGITLSYDLAGRLTLRRADDGTQFEYGYDATLDGNTPLRGRLGWVKEPHGRVELRYDQFGRNHYSLRTITGPGGTRVFDETTFAPSGAVIAQRYVPDWSARNVFDMTGRVVEVVAQHGNTLSTLWEATSYDDAGRLTGERFGNGVTGAYAFDDNGLTSSIGFQRGDGTRLYQVGLGRNAYGAVTDATDTDGVALDHTAHFDYDPAGRLVGADLAPSRGAADPFSFRYRYDSLQNMARREATAPRALGQYLGIHCYGQGGAGPRQLTSIVPSSAGANPCEASGVTPVASFTYDDAGRQVTGGGARMTYDGLDQLVAVDLADGLRVEYAYGYDGQRVRTTDNRGSVPEHWITAELREQGGAVEQYVKVDQRIVAKVNLAIAGETGGAGAAGVARSGAARGVGLAFLGVLLSVLAALGVASSARRRSWRPGLATLLVVALLIPGCGSLFSSGSDAPLWSVTGTTYFHTGFAAGPVLLTSETGQVVDERRYEPFGQPLESWRETSGVVDTIDFALDPFNILNKPTDARTGWSYHGSRWMVPETARWLTPDPPVKAPDAKFMATPWRLHPYQYVDQNPIVYWDPDGNSPVSIIIKIAAKRGAKAAVKEYVETRIKSYVKRMADKKFQKEVFDEATSIIDSFEDPWYMWVVEATPWVGDAIGIKRFHDKYKNAFDRLEKLEAKVHNKLMRGDITSPSSWSRSWFRGTPVGGLPRLQGMKPGDVENTLSRSGFTRDPGNPSHWINGKSRVRVDAPHHGPNGYRGDTEYHYHKEHMGTDGQWYKLDDHGDINADPNRNHILSGQTD